MTWALLRPPPHFASSYHNTTEEQPAATASGRLAAKKTFAKKVLIQSGIGAAALPIVRRRLVRAARTPLSVEFAHQLLLPVLNEVSSASSMKTALYAVSSGQDAQLGTTWSPPSMPKSTASISSDSKPSTM